MSVIPVQKRAFICIVALIICLTAPVLSSVLRGNNFQPITTCTCPQGIVTYECTVHGLAIVWEGTALDSCSGEEIALTKQDLVEPMRSAVICNGGTVAAHGSAVEHNCLISQLNIIFSATLQGRTVRCSVDNGTHASQVGMDVLTLSTDPYPPPEIIYLASVTPGSLIFSWNYALNCSSLRYNVQSENCGQCPNTTTGTSVYCSNFTLSNSANLCTFAVQTIICGNNGSLPLVGNLSDLVAVNLTVPVVDQVTIIPHYHNNGDLRGLTVTFSEVKSFIIYKGINGTAISYMIYYSDSYTGTICNSMNIGFLACNNGICSGELNIISSSSCRSSDINVTVTAVTNLGEGPPTNPIMEEYQNNFVRVEVISESTSINCTFLSVAKQTPTCMSTSCSATITYGDTCQEQTLLNGMRDNDNHCLVVVSLISFLEKTMSSKYCDFRVNATADMRTVTVEGNLSIYIISNPRRPQDGIIIVIVAALVPIVTLIMILGIFSIPIIILFYDYNKRRDINLKHKIFPVTNKCNMVDFAKENIIDDYDPDSGYGYYQFTEETEEYISPMTQVVLVSQDQKRKCTGSEARRIIGVSDKRERMKLPDLSDTEWKYVFIQSTSRIRILPKGSHFMYSVGERQKKASERLTATDKSLKLVGEDYKTLMRVPKDQEYPILDFIKLKPVLSSKKYRPSLGYGFYEFTKPEYISRNKQVILMDKDGKLYYGPGARDEIQGIRLGKEYDETIEVEPNFDKNKWKCAFVQTRSTIRNLKPDTWFLYCDVASSEMVGVLEPFKVYVVPRTAKEILKFAREKIPHYNPKHFYAYYEFTGRKHVTLDKNIMALNKEKKLFTGPGVFKLAGLSKDRDEQKEVKAPDLKDTEWECIFIQGKKGYSRPLEPNTRFLYCEYDPEVLSN